LNCKNVDDYVIDVCFMSCCGCYVAYETCKHGSNTFWVIKGLELEISRENGENVKEKRNSCVASRARPCVFWHGPCHLAVFLRHGLVCFGTGRACMLAGHRFSRFSYFFTHFCFELAFDVNMRVVDN